MLHFPFDPDPSPLQQACHRESLGHSYNADSEQVNDLLEYSRLNRGSQYRRKIQNSGPPSTNSDTSVTVSESGLHGVQDVESGHMINMHTEDAVNTACLGFDHQILQSNTARGANNDGPASLILNIEDAKRSDWMFSIASGSWKRICINLISNALKYTPSGFVNVTLRKKPIQRKPGKERGALVEFVVEDSGIGMSDEFQVRSLFRPFRQENNLTPGTGLVSIPSDISTDWELTHCSRD